MKLDKLFLGKDHVALSMEKFQMNYRDYLRSHRDYRQIGRILLDVAKGLKELQGIGFVHRDLKPENIVLDLKPLTVRIVDFNLWDVWALCAMVLESDMEIDEYLRIMSERGS